MSRLHEFEEVIGYHFNNQGLLRQALTHSSYANERHMKKHSDNERLEFLGDAVLEVTSSEFLYQKYPDYSEGELTSSGQALCVSRHWHFVPEQLIWENICIWEKERI